MGESKEISGILRRKDSDAYQTIGELLILEGSAQIFKCYTLELPWMLNQQRVSCISRGIYDVELRISDKYGKHFHITGVPNRDLILIHNGNYNHQTKGCVLVGSDHVDINGDGKLDVSASKMTMNKLREVIREPFKLSVEGVVG